uniref:Secreted protein n=1 Tax=Cacopsylla melanoneura TaxID=428564 RepID=A0A8D9BYH8_9HEMI
MAATYSRHVILLLCFVPGDQSNHSDNPKCAGREDSERRRHIPALIPLHCFNQSPSQIELYFRRRHIPALVRSTHQRVHGVRLSSVRPPRVPLAAPDEANV